MENGIEVTQATSEAVLHQASGLEKFYASLGANIFLVLAIIGSIVVAFILIVGIVNIIKSLLPKRAKVGRPQGGEKPLRTIS